MKCFLLSVNTLVTYLKSLEGEARAIIECTGRYHEPVVKSLSEAGIFISAVNPKLSIEMLYACDNPLTFPHARFSS